MQKKHRRGLKPHVYCDGFSARLERLRKNLCFRPDFILEPFFRSLRSVLPPFPRFVLPLETVFPASRHIAALTGQRFNRNQLPQAHQIVSRHGQPIKPIHPFEAPHLHLTQHAIQFGPAEDLLN